MMRRKFTKDYDPLIIIDGYEWKQGKAKKACALADALHANPNFKTVIKNKKVCKDYLGEDKHTLWGDYILVFPENSPIHPGGTIIGIERKAFADCYSSIISGRLNDQMAELVGKTEGRAILMVEPYRYKPKRVRVPVYDYKNIVNSKLDKISMIVPVWREISTDNEIQRLRDLCQHGWNYEIEGRGYNVKRVNNRVKIKTMEK